MDPRLNRILQNRDKMLIGIDDTFQFNCNQCGKCCMNREDILCTPKDVFRISKKLGISTYDFIKRYCDSYLGDTSHMPIVRIVPHDAAGHCPLLKIISVLYTSASPWFALCTQLAEPSALTPR